MTYQIECIECGTVFTAWRRHAIRCSKACHERARRRRHREQVAELVAFTREVLEAANRVSPESAGASNNTTR